MESVNEMTIIFSSCCHFAVIEWRKLFHFSIGFFLSLRVYGEKNCDFHFGTSFFMAKITLDRQTTEANTESCSMGCQRQGRWTDILTSLLFMIKHKERGGLQRRCWFWKEDTTDSIINGTGEKVRWMNQARILVCARTTDSVRLGKIERYRNKPETESTNSPLMNSLVNFIVGSLTGEAEFSSI